MWLASGLTVKDLFSSQSSNNLSEPNFCSLLNIETGIAKNNTMPIAFYQIWKRLSISFLAYDNIRIS